MPGKGRGRTPRAHHLFTDRGTRLLSPCGELYIHAGDSYRCRRQKLDGGAACGCPTLPRSAIDGPFLEKLIERHISAETTEAAGIVAAERKRAAVAAEIRQVEKVIRETRAAISRALVDYRSSELSGRGYEQLRNDLERDLAAAQERVQGLHEQHDDLLHAPRTSPRRRRRSGRRWTQSSAPSTASPIR